MQTHQRIWQYLQQHRLTRHLALGYAGVLLAAGTVFLGNGLGVSTAHASPLNSCDQTYIVANGDTLIGIAALYGKDAQSLAANNQITDANSIYPGQTICIPGNGTNAPANVGPYNSYPYGQCTWWADERYHQLHGIYVPWLYQSDAWFWTTRAYQNNWRVSNTPTIGAIIDFQPWVQGAGGYGHVGVVENILPNGNVIISHLNWGNTPWQVAYTEFAPGPGVTFITHK